MTRDISQLLNCVESLGDNCELGFFLRAENLESGSLFRWAITPIDALIQFIGVNVPNDGYLFDDLIPHSPGMVTDQKTGFRFHTALRSIETDGVLTFEKPEDERRETYKKEKEKYDYLVNKFVSELKSDNYKLYVIKANEGIDRSSIDALNQAILNIRQNSNFTLLYVSTGDDLATKNIVWKDTTLAFAWIREFASYSAANEINESAWNNIFQSFMQEPRVLLAFLKNNPKVLNENNIDSNLTAEQKRSLGNYRSNTTNSQKIEICYEYIKQLNELEQLSTLFSFLKKVDNEFYETLGGEIFDSLSQDTPPDSIHQFDDKYLHLSQLISNFDVKEAIEFHKQCEKLYQDYGNSLIRYQRLNTSAVRTNDVLNKFVENGSELHDISPKAQDNFLNRIITQSSSIMNQPGIDTDETCIYNVKLDQSIGRDPSSFCTNDDSTVAEKKWINDLMIYIVTGVSFYKLNNARVCQSPTGITFKENGLCKYVYEMSDMYHYFRVAGKAAFKPKEQSLDFAYILPRYGIKNYYHSLIDKLPALYGYKFLGLDCPIISTYELDPVELHFAELMGIDTSKIITDLSGKVEAERALLPDIGNLRLLFFRFCANLNQSAGTSAERKIYISRVNSPDRAMTNEAHIEKLVASHGFEIIRMEDYNLEEQIKIAASASVIMGPHGAGMANMIFAKPGCKIIELIPEKYMTPLFRQLAANCGHAYSVLIGEMDQSSIAAELSLPWRINDNRVDEVLSNVA